MTDRVESASYVRVRSICQMMRGRRVDIARRVTMRAGGRRLASGLLETVERREYASARKCFDALLDSGDKESGVELSFSESIRYRGSRHCSLSVPGVLVGGDLKL